jgi:hypothetical protein
VSIAALGLAAVVTIGLGMLYWHREITGAVDRLRRNSDDFNAHLALKGAGSRSLPYLIRELDSSEGKRWTILVTHELTFLVDRLEESGFFEEREDPRIPRVLDEDRNEDVLKKCETIRTWWRDSKEEYPPTWQFWTGRKLTAKRK